MPEGLSVSGSVEKEEGGRPAGWPSGQGQRLQALQCQNLVLLQLLGRGELSSRCPKLVLRTDSFCRPCTTRCLQLFRKSVISSNPWQVLLVLRPPSWATR